MKTIVSQPCHRQSQVVQLRSLRRRLVTLSQQDVLGVLASPRRAWMPQEALDPPKAPRGPKEAVACAREPWSSVAGSQVSWRVGDNVPRVLVTVIVSLPGATLPRRQRRARPRRPHGRRNRQRPTGAHLSGLLACLPACLRPPANHRLSNLAHKLSSPPCSAPSALLFPCPALPCPAACQPACPPG